MATATTDIKAPTRTKEDILALLAEGSVDTALFEELKKLNEGEAKKKAEKKGTVTKLVAEMEKYGITFVDLKEAGAWVSDIDKLFDANTIKLAAGGGSNRAAKRVTGTSTPREGNIQFAGTLHHWTRDLDAAAKTPLFEAFKAGKSIKAFLVKPEDKAVAARLVARLEREASNKDKKFTYSEANLKELDLTRESIKAAIEAKDKADKAQKAKAAK